MSENSEWGTIIRMISGFITVRSDDSEHSEVVCRLRGRLKKGRAEGDIAALGDRVEFTRQPDGSGTIEQVAPRRNGLVRLAPTPRGVFQQVLIANPDQVALVFAAAQPTPHLRMLDRFLVITEKEKIPALIVVNKVDLIGPEEAYKIFEPYPRLGYPVIMTAAKTGYGVDELRAALVGKTTVLAGPSGVGKSSLLNAVQPGLGLKVSAVSEQTSKGRHTTVARQMFPLTEGGYVADLPGIRSIALWDTEPEEIDGYFPELSPLVQHCQFSDCTHRGEPGCAVRLAVEEGRVSPERYRSYLRLRYGEGEGEDI